MQAAFGGTISSGPTQNHSHTVFHWKLNRQVAVEGALRGLLPFLKVKQGQAELALRFLVWRRSAPHVFGPWEAAEAASFEEAMKEAKQEVL
jgi:hypothetical protein